MATLVDIQTGQEVDVPDEQVPAALQSGQFGLDNRKRYNVVSPDGTSGSVAANELLSTLTKFKGFRMETGEESRQRVLQQEQGGAAGQLGAVAAGVARGATFGLSDQFLVQSGAVSAQTLRDQKEANPGIALGGDIAGIAAATVLTGGVLGPEAGAAGAARAGLNVGRVAGAAKGAATLGRAAAQRSGATLAPRLAAGLGERLAIENAPRLARAAGENALFGAGQLISEDALGQTELTAESLIAFAGFGALAGGTAAGIFTAGGGLARSALKNMGGAQKKAVERLYSEQTGHTAIRGLGQKLASEEIKGVRGLYAKAADIFAPNATAREIYNLIQPGYLGKVARKAALDAKGAKQKASREMAELIDNFMGLSDEIEPFAKAAFKKDQIAKVVRRGNSAQVGEALEAFVKSTTKDIENIFDNPGNFGSLGKARAKLANDSFKELIIDVQKATTSQTISAADTLAGRPAALAKTMSFDNAGVYAALDKFKRNIGPLGELKGFPGPQDVNAGQEFRKMFEKIRTLLEDEDLWGGAAEVQKRVNGKWKNVFDVRKPFYKDFMNNAEQDGHKAIWRADSGKLDSFLAAVVNPKGDLKQERFRRFLQSQAELLEEVGVQYELKGAQLAKVKKARSIADTLGKMLEETSERVALGNQLKSLGGGGLGAQFAAGGLGYMLGGDEYGATLGVSAAMLARVIANPGQLVRTMALLDGITNKFNKKVATGIDSFIDNSIKFKIPRATAPAAVNVLMETSFAAPDVKRGMPKDKFDAYNRVVQDLGEIVNDPVRREQFINEQVAEIRRTAPRVAETMTTKVLSGVQHLFDVAEKNPLEPTFGSSAQWRPTSEAVSNFSNRLAVMDDPSKVFTALNEHRLTTGMMGTYSEVYPSQARKTRELMLEKLAELKEPIGLQARSQLSIFFGSPTGPSENPSFLSFIQQRAFPQDEPAAGADRRPTRGQGGRGSRVTAIDNNDLGEMTMTKAQKAAFA